jgi:capsule polysaccharide export protein KpsC/LpsZ
MFFKDAATNKKLKAGKPKIFVVGFSTWKTYLRMYFSEYDLIFLPKDIKESQFNSQYRNKIIGLRDSCQVFIWGFKAPEFIFEFLKIEKISTKFVEDGFIRSVQLGATKAPPMSLCLDSRSPYFDATCSTELEDLLNNFDFSKSPGLLEEAREGIDILLKTGVSKYNTSEWVDIESVYGLKTKKRVLVIGQVEDDASIKFGMEKPIKNNDLVKLAKRENPDAQIIYKPHPDVLHGHRDGKNSIKEVSSISLIIDDVPLANAFETIDHVYTMTSLAGMEALLRKIKVTCLGSPFYSGWGLTDDRQANERRKRKLSLEELFAIAYLKYPRYFDPETGSVINFKKVVESISSVIGYKETNNLSLVSKLRSSLAYNDALELINKDMIQKENYELYAEKINILIETQDFSSALLTLSKALETNQKHDLFLKKAQCLRKLGCFDGEIDRAYKRALYLAPTSLKNTVAYEYFSYKWECEPINEALINEFNNYLSNVPIEINSTKSYGKLKLLLAAMLAETGQIYTALKLRKEAKALKAVDKNFLFLRYKARQRGDKTALNEKNFQSFEKLISYKGRLKTLILESRGDVCIVGNSPSLIGKGLGEEIDKHKLVIRFNSYNTDYPYSEDYGCKTDVWVRMPFHPYVKNSPNSCHKLIVFSGSNRYFRSYTEWDGILELIESGFPVEFFDPKAFYELQAQLGSPPTSGLMLCYLLYKTIGPLKKSNVYGFSYLEEVNNIYHYSDSNAESGKRHSWSSEAEIFRSLLADSEHDDGFESRVVKFYNESSRDNARLNIPLIEKEKIYTNIITVSPGLKEYEINACNPVYVSSLAVENHIEYIQSNGKSGVASGELLDINAEETLVLGFGRAKTGMAAEKLANVLQCDFKLVEYGFISSMGLPSEKNFNFSLVLDGMGIFYDTTRPSEIEHILNNSSDILSIGSIKRSEKIIKKIVENNITKYNNSADLILTESDTCRRILVIDQTANDNSILLGQCETFQFADMLQHALAQPEAEVILKLHPETIAGAKGGNLTEIRKHLDNERLTVIDQQCNVMSLIKQVDEVYVMTSGVGFEALMLGKKVRCFGVPFYSGWGLTTDMVQVKNPRRELPFEALFSALFFHYTIFFHPETKRECSMEKCIDWIIANKPSFPAISLEKKVCQV